MIEDWLVLIVGLIVTNLLWGMMAWSLQRKEIAEIMRLLRSDKKENKRDGTTN